MAHPIDFFRREHARSAAHFSALGAAVARDNLLSLRRASAAFAVFLCVYGLWAAFSFHNGLLNLFYLLFLAGDAALVLFSRLWGRRGAPAPRPVQRACMVFVVQVLAFTICVSIFPFPERPSIFYPLGYMLVTVLFQFPAWQIAGALTGMTALFVALAAAVKPPEALAYDLAGAVTSWLLGFFFLYTVTDLRLRDGEARLALDRLSRTDPLTGLANRREMEEAFERAYRRCRDEGLPVAALMLDVDGFKAYNDRYGHPAGDACLSALGRALAGFAAETGAYPARYGGEEFALLLPGCGEARAMEHAAALLERMRITGPGGAPVTVSLGAAAEVPQPGGSAARLLERADAALYRAKAAGRNRAELG